MCTYELPPSSFSFKMLTCSWFENNMNVIISRNCHCTSFTCMQYMDVDKLVKVGGLKLRAKCVEKFSLLIIHNATIYYVFGYQSTPRHIMSSQSILRWVKRSSSGPQLPHQSQPDRPESQLTNNNYLLHNLQRTNLGGFSPPSPPPLPTPLQQIILQCMYYH